MPVRQLFLLMWLRKRPYTDTGRGKGVFGQKKFPLEFFICSCMWQFEKKMRKVWESMMNCWCGTTRNHVHTYFRLSHNLLVVQQNSNLFENCQTVAQSNHTTHNQTICVTACVMQIVWLCVGPWGLLPSLQQNEICKMNSSFPHTWSHISAAKRLKYFSYCTTYIYHSFHKQVGHVKISMWIFYIYHLDTIEILASKH